MNGKSLTLELPQTTFERLEKRAQEAQHSVEEEILRVLSANLDDEDTVHQLKVALEGMNLWADQELWQAAKNSLIKEWSQRLEELHWKDQQEGLTEAEKETEACLSKGMDRAVLIRSQAMLLLKNRGHDISELLRLP